MSQDDIDAIWLLAQWQYSARKGVALSILFEISRTGGYFGLLRNTLPFCNMSLQRFLSVRFNSLV